MWYGFFQRNRDLDIVAHRVLWLTSDNFKFSHLNIITIDRKMMNEHPNNNKKKLVNCFQQFRVRLTERVECVCNLRERCTKSKFIFNIFFQLDLKFHSELSVFVFYDSSPNHWMCISLVYEFKIFNRNLFDFTSNHTFFPTEKNVSIHLTFLELITSLNQLTNHFDCIFFLFSFSEMDSWRYSNELQRPHFRLIVKMRRSFPPKIASFCSDSNVTLFHSPRSTTATI